MHVDGMRANSLALRLFLSATAWAVIILLITGVVLSSLYPAITVVLASAILKEKVSRSQAGGIAAMLAALPLIVL